jgi:apolipoprotein N-acyltransferase
MLSRLQAMSREAAGRADLVAWGESTVGDFSLDLSSFACAAEVHDHARDGAEAEQPCPALGRPLLCGGCSFAPGTSETGPYQNTAFLIAADETIIGRYHKRVLMPWGEYAVGQQWIPGLRDLLGSVDSLVAGDSATPLLLAEDARLGVLICYEDIMPHPARQTVLEGANVLVNLNNLSVFGRTAALRQHQHLARFRAIENRRWLVRCGTTGSTAAIDATGRVESQAPTNTPASLVVTARLVDTITFYTGWGDVFAGLSVLTSLILWARPDRRCIRDASGIHPAQKSRRDSDTN